MATIGQALTAPEAGWRRYNNTDSRIQYMGNWSVESSSYYDSGSASYSSDINSKVSFKFFGTALRYIGRIATNGPNNVQIKIDGVVVGTINELGGTMVYKSLNFEVINLNNDLHLVEITNLQSESYFFFDAIDIDSTGYLVHPILNQVNSIDAMQEGDCIPFRYTATTSGQAGFFSELGICIENEIPVSGTATPDGLAYFIKTAKGTLVCDRILQTNISWDTLNAAKFIEGNLIINNLIPKLTSNNDKGFIATASVTHTSSLYYANKAFDGMADTGGNYESWVGLSTTGWLCLEFPTNTVINCYSLTGQVNYQGRSPKTWTFEGSNDGTNWTILDTRTSIIGWSNSVYKTFSFVNNTPYKKYKINVTENNGDGSLLCIGELKMGNSEILIRSMSGGVAYLDTNGNSSTTNKSLGAWPPNNEWDKYIVNSDLKGKITKGDDNIWHWNALFSWVKETLILSINASTFRCRRGTTAANLFSNQTSSTTGTGLGFRPVLNYIESDIASEVIY